MTEIYKNCFENYEISNMGNCRKKLHNGLYKIIKGSILNSGGGYRYLQIMRNGKRKNYLFHRWVAKCFLGEQPKDKPFVDHINRKPLDNRVENLRWINHQDNLRNTDRFRDDIKAEGKERKNALYCSSRNNILSQKKYYCKLCDINCQCPSHLEIHKNGFRHKLKEKRKQEMKDNNIEWTKENYKKWKCKINHKQRNPENTKRNNKKYRDNNKNKIKEWKRVKIICICGSNISRGNKSTHEKSIKHINFINSQ